MSKAKPKKPDPWQSLKTKITSYAQAAIDESWKGGGDPADMDVLTLRLQLAWLELTSHIEKMRREYE